MLNTIPLKKPEVSSKIKNFLHKKPGILETKEEKISNFIASKKLDFKKIMPAITKKKDSYALNQAKSLINKLNLKKETTLKKLVDLSMNDLKPLQDKEGFNPEEMFEKNTEDDDLYLKEYQLNPKEKQMKICPKQEKKTKNSPKQEKTKKSDEKIKKIMVVNAVNFRKNKSKSPPRQNVFEGNRDKRDDLMRSPINDVNKPDYKTKMFERANIMDLEKKEKENQVFFFFSFEF